MTKYMLLGALALGVACTDDGKDSGDADDTGTGTTETGTTVTTPTSFSVAWNAKTIDVTVNGGTGSYKLGMAETSKNGWTGEDCYLGYTTGKGKTYLFCHTIDADATTTLNITDDLGAVADGTTLLGNPKDTDPNDTVYMASEQDDSACWTWADSTADATYYDALGCQALK